MLKQIFMPHENTENVNVTYENQLKPRIKYNIASTNTTKKSLWQFYKNYETEIMDIVVKNIHLYLQSQNNCNDNDNLFPQIKKLTGQWYVGSIYLAVEKEKTSISIMTRFTEKLIVNSREIVTDYLGLEINIEYCNDKNKFVFENLNISSI